MDDYGREEKKSLKTVEHRLTEQIKEVQESVKRLSTTLEKEREARRQDRLNFEEGMLQKLLDEVITLRTSFVIEQEARKKNKLQIEKLKIQVDQMASNVVPGPRASMSPRPSVSTGEAMSPTNVSKIEVSQVSPSQRWSAAIAQTLEEKKRQTNAQSPEVAKKNELQDTTEISESGTDMEKSQGYRRRVSKLPLSKRTRDTSKKDEPCPSPKLERNASSNTLATNSSLASPMLSQEGQQRASGSRSNATQSDLGPSSPGPSTEDAPRKRRPRKSILNNDGQGQTQARAEVLKNGSGTATAQLHTDGSVVAWGSKSCGGDCSKVQHQLTSDVLSIHFTKKAFAAVKVDGTVVAWGKPEYGGRLCRASYDGKNDFVYDEDQEIQDQLASNVLNISSTHSAFAALKRDGSVVTWGCRDNGGDHSYLRGFLRIGPDPLESDVRAVYATDRAFAALKADGSVLAWGKAEQIEKARSKALADQS
eukprot:gnl/MRDRNA2_/MRDRNA2_78596_c0_seq1.p1 gnl/MRDRNA2_/MRDRNA2_78596_c0~~gnl/MRDRNA2_/MRDRNA2_78596_c0_seq1.p1  ORF type:complete len:506 (-),score=81.59 gnl/MRDRNA2_/MRDRNA2_78596_c0_seq1:76-1509(-)